MRGKLKQKDYRPQFSGHETFPMRYGWLKKAFDTVSAREEEPRNKSIFSGEDAIAHFGVGKNMVLSIRHWAYATGILCDASDTASIQTTDLGKYLFGKEGADPYMEHSATLWMMHWYLCSRPKKTTWFWCFNHYPNHTFERAKLAQELKKLTKEYGWAPTSDVTLKHDVACFIRTYVPQTFSRKRGHEDALESPLVELGLIKSLGKQDGFRFVRGSKPTLGNGVFCYALIDFWKSYSPSSATLSFEAIAHEPGSPGRNFLLDEDDVYERLSEMEKITGGVLQWSETAGLRQMVRKDTLEALAILDFLNPDYASAASSKAV